jgi:hypothetical protein
VVEICTLLAALDDQLLSRRGFPKWLGEVINRWKRFGLLLFFWHDKFLAGSVGLPAPDSKHGPGSAMASYQRSAVSVQLSAKTKRVHPLGLTRTKAEHNFLCFPVWLTTER